MSHGLNRALYNMDDSQTEYEQRNVEAIACRWDAKASLWDEQLQQPDSHLNQDGAYDCFISDALLLLNGLGETPLQLLEIGCGTALVSEALQREHVTITGVDISEKMLDKAREKQILNASFFCKDVFSLPIEGEPLYNLILSRGILLSHYSKDDAVALLSTIKKCGLPSTCTVAMLDFLNADAIDSSYHRPANKTYYTSEDIQELAEKVGIRECRFTGSSKHRTRCVILQL